MKIPEVVKELSSRSKRFKIKKAPKQNHPLAIEKKYESNLLKLVRKQHKLLKQYLYPQLPKFVQEYTVDTYADETQDITNFVDEIMAGDIDGMITRNMVYSTALSVGSFNKKQVDKVFRKMVGVDLFSDDINLQKAISPFVTENVNLIKTIPQEYTKRVRNAIAVGARNGFTSTEVAKLLEKEFKITKNRAKLIARDQIGKFNGNLTRIRQERVGIKEYTWRTSLDERVRGNPSGRYPNARPSHFAREGKKFKYKKPPPGGNPGEPVQCRCTAEPVIEL